MDTTTSGGLRDALLQVGVEVDRDDAFRLDARRRVHVEDAAAAGLVPRVVWTGKRPAVARSAARALLDETATSDELWWAIAHGWHEGGRRVRYTTSDGVDGHRQDPTPERDLDRLLAALLALRPLALGNRPGHAVVEGWAHDEAIALMARQAVRRLRDDAATWVRIWAARGNTTLEARRFVTWLDGHAVPWRRAMPRGHDPIVWAETHAPEWEAAGYSPAQAGTLAALPEGHPDRPDRDQLLVMAALRGD